MAPPYALDLAGRERRGRGSAGTPAVRMATSCFAYSLVPGHKSPGATKAEILAAIHGPAIRYATAEEIFNALVAAGVKAV